MTEQRPQDRKFKFLDIPPDDATFGLEANRKRIEAEQAEEKRQTLVSKLRGELAEFEARHRARREAGR